MVIAGNNNAWIVYATGAALGLICFITKIVLQHKVRVSFLEKQREKGRDLKIQLNSNLGIIIDDIRIIVYGIRK